MDLYHAADEGDLERVHLLVEQGVDKDETGGYYGGTPLYAASRNGHLPDMEKASSGSGWTPLITASYYGRFEAVRYLLEQGANRDKVDTQGTTPLHWAAECGHLETAKLLMVYGADLNARNNNGNLPIGMRSTTEAIRQAIRDEPRRRMDHGHKRATEQDRHPNVATSASAQQEEKEEEAEEQSNKKQRLDEGTEKVEGNVAEEDEDSEPSDEEDDD